MKQYSLLAFALITAFGWQASGDAAEYSRDVTVTQILPIAADRPAASQSANLVRVYVNSASWGASTCNQDSADLQVGDKHLISALLTAWASGKLITIAVDDSRRPYDTTCQVTWLAVK